MPRKEIPAHDSGPTRLAELQGADNRRSLEALAAALPIQDSLLELFSEPTEPGATALPDRRRFLQLMGASLALAGLQGCTPRQPDETIVPYVRPPEALVQNTTLEFATSMPQTGGAIGLIAKSYMGRPLKLEGNPGHPASLGATDAYCQASILDLYDPERAQTITQQGFISNWSMFVAALERQLDAQRTRQGAGLRLLTEPVLSPTLAAQIDQLLRRYPAARWHQWEPVHRDYARQGALRAFGRDVTAVYRLEQAQVIFSLDADLLCSEPGGVRNARQFASRRRVQPHSGQPLAMNRLYVAESTPSPTGAIADHRLPLPPVAIETLAYAVAERLGVSLAGQATLLPASIPSAWVDAVVADLMQGRAADGKPATSVVIAGRGISPAVHALAAAMNSRLGAIGSTVIYTEPVELRPVDQTESLAELVQAMRAKEVEVLVILSGNPVFNAPADFNFGPLLSQVPMAIHTSLLENETSTLCDWHLPATHYLEYWSDVRGPDGTLSVIQPLIAPLYQNVSPHEILAALLGKGKTPEKTSGYEILRRHWQQRLQQTGQAFENTWQRVLHDGLLADSESPALDVSLQPLNITPKNGNSANGQQSPNSQFELVFRPDPSIFDGRYANNGWLQELPKPLSKLTWDNAALVSPATAAKLGVKTGDVVRLRVNRRICRLPAFVTPGHADDCVTVHFGYGSARTGKVAAGTGVDVYPLRHSSTPWVARGLEIRSTGKSALLAITHEHHRMEGRDIVRSGTFEQLQANPEHPSFMESHAAHGPLLSFYPEHPYDGYRWGMTIDQSLCIGCNACIAACNAENNIPVVGKTEVLRGREMHWLRIDTYYHGPQANPTMLQQAMLCQHCELAPCEVVCPVAATVHSPEGLNEMVYNRCVGTRYCSNNCPYKVRRFNFFQYTPLTETSLNLFHNPQVTVRNRGVMEKCTFCVQRISHARIQAELAGKPIQDGQVVTACQAACPTQAIVFGDLNDTASAVHRSRQNPLNYQVLAELNTRPRISYSAVIRNPHPGIHENHAPDA